ncbi:hypothetical protein LQG66_01685 [Bradyrhizobium ontarionense]|uniref:N-acetyltransferase domain-containing protein n=1 Tax=Bradyrhizobium ontarionense TaxID=2898149 RepID=A0ABY3RED5_9BRAD|nr:hypothetical protein [Bradyrhizobium sp. A19]UFZ05058.1 hypothetical protein LQG66_01685 [Bradyrhizobium sp. A19]
MVAITGEQRAAEAIEVKAWQDLLDVMPAQLKTEIGGDGRIVGGALVISARNVPLVTFNRVIGLGLERPVERHDLREIARQMRSASAPVAQLQIAPFALSSGLEADLADEGFGRAPTVWAKMGRRTARPPVFDTEFTIDLAGPADAELYADTVLAGFGMPRSFSPWLAALPGRAGWRCYLARAAGETLAAAALYLDGDSAWLGMAATLPTSRKRGAQSALIARRIADAAALGKSWAFTETGILDGPNPSLANMERAGFECLHERTNWVLKGWSR